MRARFLTLLFLATSAFGLVPVTGKMVDPSGTGLPPANSFVRFELRNCGGNRPRILGVADLAKTTFDFRPDALGNISGSIYANTEIDCGGARPTEWAVTYFYNGAPSGVTKTYTISGAFDLTAATSNTVAPVIAAPTGDSTYLRLDGGNSGSAVNPFSFGSQFLDTLTTNQIAVGASGHRTTLNLPAPAGNVTLNFPITADTVVGRVTTDTLTNKTLTSPVITSPTITGAPLSTPGAGNSATLLNQQGPSIPIVGNGTDVNVFSYSLAANQVAAGKGLRITVGLQHSNGTGNVTYKLLLGGVTIDAASVGNDSVAGTSSVFEIFNNAGVQNAQNWLRRGIYGTSATAPTVSVSFGTSTVDLANSQTLAFMFNAANTDQITPKFFLVELIQ